MSTNTTGGRSAPQPSPGPGPSFVRRHPILAGFGVLAALSLFAAYWPASAVITGVIVAGRATGFDRVVYNAARRGFDDVVSHLRHAPSTSTQPPEPTPTAPSAEHRMPGVTASSSLRTPRSRTSAVAAHGRPRRRAQQRERHEVGAGREGPGLG
ncbi:MAG: hypothetical protein JOY80_04860 [Candidatus Dormibacteraeota bacterium]|nr:hypothetical protein [Candidatus Dormibacteraeota bacterium]